MDDIIERVQKAFYSAFDLSNEVITSETNPSDIPAWDSMGHVVLASSLEQEFQITFDVDELMAMETVGDIVKILQVKTGPR